MVGPVSGAAARAGASSTRAERRALAAILALALGLRVAFVLAMRANPFFDDPQSDELFYVDWARAIVRGEPAFEGPFPVAPLYPWWLALCFRVFGEGLLAPRLLQAVIGTVSVALVHGLARRFFDAATALVAATLAAVYWLLVYYDGALLRDALAGPLSLGAMTLIARADERRTLGAAALAGLALGLAALLRPQVLLLAPPLAAWVLWRGRGAARAALARVVVLAAAAAAPIAPVTAYNALVGGDLVLISPEGGQMLWTANNPEADVASGVVPGTRADFEGHNVDARALAESEAGRPLKPSEVSAHYRAKTLDWWREEPLAGLALLGRKTWLFWTDHEFGTPEEPRFFAERFAPFLTWLPLGFGALAAFAALGLHASRRDLAAQFPLWGFGLVYAASVVVFLVAARYRLPVVPVLIVYAAAGAVGLARDLAARRFARAGISALAAAAVYALAHTYPVPAGASQANGLYWLGIAEARAGRPAAAAQRFAEALELRPDFGYVRRARSVVLRAEGRSAEALAELERAVAAAPRDVESLDALADLELALGRPREARQHAERSIEAAPWLARSRYDLGRARHALGDLAGAAEAFAAALERDGQYFNAAYSLGLTLAELGRGDEALAAVERAAAASARGRQEFVVAAYGELVRALVSRGRTGEARRRARELAELYPDDPRARALLGSL